MNIAFSVIEEGLKMGFEDYVLILVVVGGLIFFAKDFKLGIVMWFFVHSLLFLWFYTGGLNWSKVLITFFIGLVLMSLSLFSINKTVARRGFT